MRLGRKRVSGTLRKGARTKDLVKQLRPGDLALIRHADLDAVAAEALVRARVAAVVNASPCQTGSYPNRGPEVVVEGGVPLFELICEEDFDRAPDDAPATLELATGALAFHGDGGLVLTSRAITREEIARKTEAARQNLRQRLTSFVQNTLDYVSREEHVLIGSLTVPELRTALTDRHALIVVRGEGYRKDLETIRGYIHDVRPAILAVDGGADALRELGFKPDLILGDMDSVSDEALRAVPEILVHAYPGREAPGMARIEALGLAGKAKIIEATGTSEDVAMLVAHEKGASLLVAVGTHSTMTDFLDKGRPGMASTFLTRLKVGDHLVDARGVRHLYGQGMRISYIAPLLLVGLVAACVIVLCSESVQTFLQLLGYRMSVSLRSLFGLGF